MKTLSVSVFASACLAACAARACDVCATHVALGSWESDHRFSLSLYNQFSRFDDGHELDSLNSQLAAQWWVSDRFAVQAGAPYIRRELDGETESGIGDATLLGIFRVYRSANGGDATIVDIYAGVKLPTGDSDPLKEDQEAAEEAREHEEHGHDAGGGGHAPHAHGHVIATGSGSTDGIFGARALVKRGRWQASAGAQYILRTEGDHDYEYGDDLILGASARWYALLSDDNSVAIGIDVSSDDREPDSVLGEEGEDNPTAAYAGPAIDVNLGENLSLNAALDLPIAGRNEGLHGAADHRVRLGLGWLF